MRADAFVDRLDGVEQVPGGWKALCPAHGDTDQSLAIKEGDDGRILLQCHAKCETLDVLGAMGLGFEDLYVDGPGSPEWEEKTGGLRSASKPPHKKAMKTTSSKPKKRKEFGRIVEQYWYTDEEGHNLFQAIRLEPKDFMQRRLPRDGDDPKRVKGGWVWSVTDARSVPYRLQALIAAVERGETVYIPEGEKDVHTAEALGLTATCNAAGVMKWKPEHSEFLRGADVVILPDDDPETKNGKPHRKGQLHGAHVAGSLDGIAARVRVFELPCKDLSDWVEETNGSKEDLEHMIEADAVSGAEYVATQEAWQKAMKPKVEQIKLAGPPVEMQQRPQLWATEDDMSVATHMARTVLLEANEANPELFWFGGRPSRIVSKGDRRSIGTVGLAEMRLYMADNAHWRKKSQGQVYDASPPKGHIEALLAHADLGLPVLRRFADVPCCVGGGEVVSTRGFDKASGLYLEPSRKWDIAPWAIDPSIVDMERSRSMLLEDVLGDFPFVGEPDIANALAFLIGIVSRNMIDGPVPHFMISKPTPGTGATLLTEVLTCIGLGSPVNAVTFSRSEEELEKKIASMLLRGQPVIFFDNVSRRIDSSSLAAAVTSREFTIRILGKTETADVPVYCSWISSGNNPTVSNEMARRTLRIHLDASVERPQDRDPGRFRHPDLMQWAKANADELLSAVICLVRWWAKQGRPAPTSGARLGMFESWLHVAGGVLESCNVKGLLDNQGSLYEESDSEGNAWREFVTAWWDEHREAEVSARVLMTMETTEDVLPLRGNTEVAKRTSLGKLLSSQKGRIYDGMKIVKSARLVSKSAQWKLERVDPDVGHDDDELDF